MFQVLDKFLKKIVKKEAWYKRQTEAAKDLLCQKDSTTQSLLSNDFVSALNRDHRKHEQKKQEDRQEVYQKLKKQVLLKETQSIKDISESGLPTQGSLQINFGDIPGPIQETLSENTPCDTGSMEFYRTVDSNEPDVLNVHTRGFSFVDHNKSPAEGNLEEYKEIPEESSDDEPSHVQDNQRNAVSKIGQLSPRKRMAESLGTTQVYDVLTKSTEGLEQNNDPSSSTISILKPEASASTLYEARTLFNEAARIGNKKSSRDTRSSGWTLKRFSTLVTLDNFAFVDDTFLLGDVASEMDIQQGEFQVLIDQLKQALRIYCVTMGDIQVYDASCFAYLHHKDTMESLIKLFMNHIIGLLCAKKGLKVHHEMLIGQSKQRKVDTQDLLTSRSKFTICPRSDYILEHKGEIIGSVELKAPRSINKNCIVPLMLQLLKIQHYQQNPNATYTGILTDGYKYIVLFLHGTKFTFEKDCKDVNIHKAKTWADIMKIMEVLCKAVDICIIGRNTLETACKPHLELRTYEATVTVSDDSDDDIFEL